MTFLGRPQRPIQPIQKTPADMLFEAVEANSLEEVQRLLTSANKDKIINAQDRFGRTPLILAVDKDLGEMARILLMHGADTTLENQNRTTALDIARDKDYNGIYQMIYDVENTMWRPGEDPDLLHIKRDPVPTDRQSRDMAVIEKSQIQDILEAADLGEYFENFEQHKITFLDFLRVDDDCLKKLGIDDPEDRAKIVDEVKKISDRKWQDDSKLPVFMRKNVSSFEITTILRNLDSHVKSMKEGLDFAVDRLERNPETLRLNLEPLSMENIYNEIGRIQNQADNFINKIHEFAGVIVNKGSGKVPEKSSHRLLAVVGTSLFVSLASCAAVFLYRSRN